MDNPQINGMSAGEVLQIISMFREMLTATEGRILSAMGEHSKTEATLWAKHDAQLASDSKKIIDRFERIEHDLEVLTLAVGDHHRLEHEAKLIMEARVRPIRGSIAWIWANRRDIIIIVIGIIAASTFMLDLALH